MEDSKRLIMLSVSVLLVVALISMNVLILRESSGTQKDLGSDVQDLYLSASTDGIAKYVNTTITGQTAKQIISKYYPSYTIEVKKKEGGVITRSMVDTSGFYKFNMVDSIKNELTDNMSPYYLDASAKFTVMAEIDTNERITGLVLVEE